MDIDGNNTLQSKDIGVTISTFETLPLPERAKYPCDCVVVMIVSIEVPRAKTQTPPDLVVKSQAIDIMDFILWLVLRVKFPI